MSENYISKDLYMENNERMSEKIEKIERKIDNSFNISSEIKIMIAEMPKKIQDEILEKTDRRYASKIVEKILYGFVGAILLGVIGAVLNLIIN